MYRQCLPEVSSLLGVHPIAARRYVTGGSRLQHFHAMAKRLIPLLDRVLIEKVTAPSKSVGGVLLPESAVSKVRLLHVRLSTCRHAGQARNSGMLHVWQSLVDC